MALFVKHSGKHAAAQKAGSQKDNVIVEPDGLGRRHRARDSLSLPMQ